jgi:diguanylate cyclase (GGDEF)-like protein
VEGPRPGQHALPEELRRERLVDIEQRLARYRRAAFAVLAVGLLASGPWLGWLWLIPLGLAGAAFAVTDRLIRTSTRPERWAAASWAMAPLMIAVSVALTGGPESPALAWFALPAITLAARFETGGVLAGIGWTLGLVAASTLGVGPGATIDDPSALIFPVAACLAAVILAAALAQSERQYRHDAVIDSLTGLLNRAALADRFAEIELQSQRDCDPKPIGFVLGDLDHFKSINDRHGHDRGDAVLRDVAYALRGSLRAYDLVYRVGGEEFVVLLPGADIHAAADVSERLRQSVQRCSQPDLPVSMSFGVASAKGSDVNFTRLYKQADVALYGAKRAGRNRVCATGLLGRSGSLPGFAPAA